jgi:hypothetical protein
VPGDPWAQARAEERAQPARQAKRIVHEITSDKLALRRCQVSLVEHEIQDAEDGAESLGKRLAIGDLVRDAGPEDLLLCSSDALSDRRFVCQERTRDFDDAETPERAQRQRDLGLAREGGVAAGEDEAQLIVGYGRDLELVLRTVDLLLEADRKC